MTASEAQMLLLDSAKRTPLIAASDSIDLCSADTVGGGDVVDNKITIIKRLPNLSNLRIGEFASAVFAATFIATSVSAFCYAVMNVIAYRSNRKVRWIAARRIVARVQYVEMGRYRAFSQKVREAMRHPSVVLKVQHPIAITISRASPWPTHIGAIRLINACPKLRYSPRSKFCWGED